MSYAFLAAWIRLDFRTRIATVAKWQTCATPDIVGHLLCKPDALPRSHQPGHTTKQVFLFVTMKEEIALNAK